MLLFFVCLPDVVNSMVVAVEVMGSVHALDFVQSHDVEVTVDADVVHVDQHVPIVNPVLLEVVATVAIVLMDTVNKRGIIIMKNMKCVNYEILTNLRPKKSKDKIKSSTYLM